MRPRILCAALVLAAWPALAAGQSFDNFEQSTLPPGPLAPGVLPDSGQAPSGAEALDPSWLRDNQLALPPIDEGVVLRSDPDGQSGVRLEMFPGVSGPVTSISQPRTQNGGRVALRALDRMLGRPTDIELEIGQTVLFGRIAINVLECRFPTDNPSSDAFAHIRIFGTDGAQLFDGWMVASSPALSALEHPRYDVWVLRCSSTS